MDVRVRFVFNVSTGEVEEFLIDDAGSRLSREDHNREHDRVSAEIGHVLDKNVRVSEIRGGARPVPAAPIASTDEQADDAALDRGEDHKE
jgi:hypothetical protein